MARIQSSGGNNLSANVDLGTKSGFTTTGATIGTTETTIVIPVGAKAFRLHTAKGSNAVLTVASSMGGTSSATTSFDIGMGNIWVEEGLIGDSSITIYIKSSKATTDVQVLTWF